MNTTKSQSSILILATIGVYFGLVLVGAAPQLHAHTLKSFTKAPAKLGRPDVNTEFTDVPLQRFLDRLKLEVAASRLDLSQSVHIKLERSFETDKSFEGLKVFVDGENTDEFLLSLRDFLTSVDESNLFYTIVDRKRGQSIDSAAIDVLHNETGTTFGISLKTDSPATAEKAVGGFQALFSIAKSVRKGTPEVKFYENASITFDNDQVSVVTHMPRAALEEFLTGREQ